MRKQFLLLLSLLLYAVGVAAQAPDWGHIPNTYPDEHVVYVGLVDSNDRPIYLHENSYLGAFIDGECRGLVQATSKYVNSGNEGIEIYYFPMRINGTDKDEGKTITFRYLSDDRLEYDLSQAEPLTFKNNATTGTLSALYKLQFIRPLYYSFTQTKVEVNVGKSLDMMQFIKFEPQNANVPQNPEWDFANSKAYFEVVDNQLIGKAPIRDFYLGVNFGYLKFNGERSSFSVDVIQPATSLALLDEYKDGITVNLGDTAALNSALRSCYTVEPANYNEQLTWKSSDETAIVPLAGTAQGKFDPQKTGTYTMTLSGANVSVSLKVTVVKGVTHILPVGKVSIINMYVGESLTKLLPAGYEVYPTDATDTRVVYTIDNINNTVPILQDNNGDIVGANPGMASVKITSVQNPKAFITYYVYVKPNVATLSFKQAEMSISKPESDTDQTDFSKEIRANIVFAPSWPQYSQDDPSTMLNIASTEIDVINVNYGFMTDTLYACPGKLGQSLVKVKYSTALTQATDSGLVDTIVELADSFKVNVVNGIKGFTLEQYIKIGNTDTYELTLTPDPVGSIVDPSRISVEINSSMECPEEWKLATLTAVDKTGLKYTVVPASVGKGTISVSLDGKEVATSTLVIGQRYMQKAGWKWASFYDANTTWNSPDVLLGDVVEEIRTADALLHNDPEYGYFGNVYGLNSGVCYKIKVSDKEPGYLDLLVTEGYTTTTSYDMAPMWNWLANPYQYDHDIYAALNNADSGNKFTDGDRIVSKDDGFAEYMQGKWTGSLSVLRAGHGYMFYNASTETTTITYAYEYGMPQGKPVMNAPQRNRTIWVYNSAPFADNMTIVADLGEAYSTDNFSVGAFVGDECRGEGMMIDGKCFITAHADKGETISFRLYNETTGEMRSIDETLLFAKTAGSIKAPFRMNVGGVITGINASDIERSGIAIVDGQITVRGLDVKSIIVCNAAGAIVSTGATTINGLPSGVYVVKVMTNNGKTVTKKIVK